MFSFNERYEMAKEKCKPFENVEVSNLERNVPDNWRYIDTLKNIEAQLSNGEQLYTAMGSDSFQQFSTWASWETILDKSKLIVFRRPGYENNFPDVQHEYVYMDNDISSTKLRENLRIKMSEDFDIMMDDMTWAKEYFEEFGEE